MARNNKREMPFLLGLLVVMAIIFIITFLAFTKVYFLLSLGMVVINVVVLILALVAMLKVAWHIVFY